MTGGCTLRCNLLFYLYIYIIACCMQFRRQQGRFSTLSGEVMEKGRHSLEACWPVRKPKTSDFFEVKFRCFAPKVRRFATKKSDVLHFRSLSLQKKFCVFLLHFLHQSLRFPLYIGDFRWRIGCRIQAGCRINPTFSVSFILFFPLFGPQDPAFSYDSVPDIARNCSAIERFHDNSSGKYPTRPCKTGREVSQNSAVGVG